MAKFCGNCGTRLDDNAKICGNCGTPLDGVSVGITGLKVENPEKKKKRKGILKGIVALLALVLVSVITFNVVSQYTGYRGLLRKVMTAYEEYDIDGLISLASDMYYYGEEDGVEYYFENIVGENLDSFESSVGHSYKLTYEVNETYVMSERKKEATLNEIQNTYVDFDSNKIEEIVVANLTLTAKQGNTTATRDINIIMSKENGSWRLLYIE